MPALSISGRPAVERLYRGGRSATVPDVLRLIQVQSRHNSIFDLAGFCVASECFLREDDVAIESNLKSATTGWDQLPGPDVDLDFAFS